MPLRISTDLARRGVIAGIYKITAPSGNFYVGSSVDLFRRKREHIADLRSGRHCNRQLSRAWARYPEALEFSILLVCAPDDALFYEQRALNILKPRYNLCREAGSLFGLSKSAAHRDKISRALMGHAVSEATREKISLALQGRPLRVKRKMSAVAVAAMRDRMIGRKASPETRAKMSASAFGRKKSAETRARMTEAKLAYWAKRKGAADA